MTLLFTFLKKFTIEVLPFIVVFCASLYNSADLDLGWHLKYGQYFLEHGQVLKQNIFSTQMQGYYWANTSWGTDVLTYTVFKNFGFLGITILGALVITLTFFFFSKAASLNFWDQAIIFSLLIYLEEPVNSASFRVQLMSLLFLGILCFILSKTEGKRSKLIFYLIPLFLVWANMHGGFILGLLVFLVWIAVRLIKTRSFDRVRINLPVFLASLAVTFINPFGFGAYEELNHHFSSEWQKHIIEWTPFDAYSAFWWSHIVMGVLVLFSVLYLIQAKKFKGYLPFAIIAVVLFSITFFARRYEWPFYYLSVVFIKQLTGLAMPRNTRVAVIIPAVVFLIYILFAWKKINTTLAVINSGILVTEFNVYGWSVYCNIFSDCSPKAAEFLIKNKLTDNLLTFYDWGGWLIWNYPEIKPSIDGRMPSWQDDKGYSAFNEYYLIEQNKKDVDKTSFNVVLMSPRKPVYYRLLDLTTKGKWKLVYKDKLSGIFVRVQ